jgi:hypothetical protein
MYGSWIDKYLCNQSLSPLKLRVRIALVMRCTCHNFMFVSELRQVVTLKRMFKLCIKYDRINYFFSSLCIENETISESDCQEWMFDLFVETIRVGPGSSYLESVFPG